MAPVLLCVSVDCECDKGPAWKTQRPLRFTGVHGGIAGRIHPLLSKYGGKPTYLLSPEVVRDPGCVEALASLRDCELGTHLHGEMAEPGAFAPEVTLDVQREYPPEIERAKMASLTESFRVAFGRAPASFRAGRFGIGPGTISILEQLGYAVDSSVTPGVDWSRVSRGLTFAGAPRQPYHPDPADPATPGRSSVLEVPVTTAPSAAARLPLVGRLAGPRWLRPTRTGARALVRTARDAVERARREDPGCVVVLNAMFHNVEVVAGASPYAATDAAAATILSRLEALLAWAQSEGAKQVGLADVAGEIGSRGAREAR
ncbi:MAG: hypothetical protein ACRENE_16190 [Polyangiaceae bacterium]